jgi:hypothetical protein
MTEFAKTIVTLVVGFLIAIFAEPLRRWFYRPVLRLDFANDDRFVSPTVEGDPPDHHARYVRLRATNVKNSMAKSCRAFLIGFDRRGQSGSWDPTDYCDNIPLRWSCEKSDALDLPKDVPHFIDVLSTRESSKDFQLHLAFLPHRYQHLLSATETYRLTVLVTGDGLKPAKMSISFKWTGVWDQFEVFAL